MSTITITTNLIIIRTLHLILVSFRGTFKNRIALDLMLKLLLRQRKSVQKLRRKLLKKNLDVKSSFLLQSTVDKIPLEYNDFVLFVLF